LARLHDDVPATPAHLYVHVPFCKDRCVYCAFATVRDRPADHAHWLEAVLSESASHERLPEPATLYIGGGTPSLLSSDHLNTLIKGLINSNKSHRPREITLEANPSDITPQACRSWHEAGVTRISIGIQTLNTSHLKDMARLHDSAAARDALEVVTTSWKGTWSADLLVGWGDQVEADVASDVATVLQYAPPHVSIYGLTLEPGTTLDRRREELSWLPISEDRSARLDAAWTHGLIDAGLERYEVSNFARPGHRSQHNQAYWANRPYLGLGPGASSSVGQLRWSNVRPAGRYAQLSTAGRSVRAHVERLAPEARLLETLASGLRTRDGISTQELDQRFSPAWREPFTTAGAELLDAGRVLLDDHTLRIPADDLTRVDRILTELVQAWPLT